MKGSLPIMLNHFRHTLKDQTALYVFVSVLFLMGVIFGALLVNALSLEQQQDLSRYLSNFFTSISQGGTEYEQLPFAKVAALHLKWLGLIWILGLSVIGLPGIFVLDFFKGVLIGFTVGCLVGQFSWKGLLFALIAVAPHNLIVIPALLAASVAATSFSLGIIRSRILMKLPNHNHSSLLSYCSIILLMAGVILIAACFETWVTPMLMRLVA
jgi:stage II sporulation protein M